MKVLRSDVGGLRQEAQFHGGGSPCGKVLYDIHTDRELLEDAGTIRKTRPSARTRRLYHARESRELIKNLGRPDFFLHEVTVASSVGGFHGRFQHVPLPSPTFLHVSSIATSRQEREKLMPFLPPRPHPPLPLSSHSAHP